MSTATAEAKKSGLFAGLVDGAARAFSFRKATARPAATTADARPTYRGGTTKGDIRSRTPEIQRLAAEGIPTAEIARRTAISQDTVSLLLHLAPTESVDSAGRGTFFRILQTRMDS